MDPESSSPPTRVCVLTPEGRGAIAVVRVWGPRAVEVVDRSFRPSRGIPLSQSPPGRLRYGRMGEGVGDEVVAVVDGGTATPEVEIHCHGGSAAVALVIEALESAGAERRQPVAWVRQGAHSATEAEAAVDLGRATTLRAVEILLEQEQGALTAETLRALALLRDDSAASLARIEILLARSSVGLRLVSGWRIVLAGRPNVGKSRLLNALAGFDRAIVDPTPGTTRDVVTVRTALDGWPVELADTAGLRASDDPIEASGIARAQDRQQKADLVVVVLDRSERLTAQDEAILAQYGDALVVANKCDLAAAWSIREPFWQTVSAERGDRIESLGRAIASRLVPDAPEPGAGVPFRPGHVRLLAQAREAITAGDLPRAEHLLRTLIGPLSGRSSAALHE